MDKEMMKMITKQDIFEALGADSNDRFLSGMLVGIGVGALVGGVVAMLLAPKTGSELRQMIGERGSDLISKAKDKIGAGKNGGATTESPV
jgi:hypothetical protein